MYSQSIEQLIRAFEKLPTVGRRTAERFVFYLLKSGKKDVAGLTLALKTLIGSVKSCAVCWDFSDTSPCSLCSDPKRDAHTICIVAEPQDVQAIERAGVYFGKYHVLRGTLRADNIENAEKLTVISLLGRTNGIREIVLALNPDLHGETTMMYLKKQLIEHAPHVKISRLARGLPMGSDLQYADEITLGSAFQYRVDQGNKKE